MLRFSNEIGASAGTFKIFFVNHQKECTIQRLLGFLNEKVANVGTFHIFFFVSILLKSSQFKSERISFPANVSNNVYMRNRKQFIAMNNWVLQTNYGAYPIF